MKQIADEGLAAIHETGTGALAAPFACAHCGTPESWHGWRYHRAVGVHEWQRPTEDLMKQRMLARRAIKEQQ